MIASEITSEMKAGLVPSASDPLIADLETRPQPLLKIRPSQGQRSIDLKELWHYRELLWFLAERDIKVRYKQTAFGVAWAVLQPLCTMIVFSIFFGGLADIPSDGVPYPLFALVGLLPWQLFAYALSQSSNSLVNEQRLITKVYFPRLLVPVASVLSGLADFVVAFVLVLGAMCVAALAGYDLSISWPLIFVPVFVVLAIASALAVGLWLAALNVQYRDVRYTLPFLTQLWLLLTPIAYPTSLIPPQWRALYGLNPLAAVVEGFRWALVGGPPPDLGMTIVSIGIVCGLLWLGMRYFRRMEVHFADII